MSKHLVYFAVAVIALTALVSCESEDSPVWVGSDVDVLTWEAERAVMLLGHDPGDVPVLVAEIGHDIMRIRAKYGRWFDFDGHRVHFPWNAFKTWLALTPEGEQRLQSGDWPELDAVVTSLGADSVSQSCGSPAVFYSQPRCPCVVARAFADVEDIVSAHPIWWFLVCDDPCGFIWPIPTDEGMGYMFEYRFDGDATSEPEPRTYYYFEVIGRSDPQYIGSYLPGVYPTPHDDEKPAWWDRMDGGRHYGCSD